jgi:hypothetical protein
VQSSNALDSEMTVDDAINNTTDEEERIISPTNYNYEGAATDDIYNFIVV